MHHPDERLLHAEAIMEQYPDSALAILDAIDLPSDASTYDRNLFILLLSHARYKNFLEFENDSILLDAAEYFADERVWSEASKAFFLLGWSQMDVGRLGGAVLSLKRGLRMACKDNSYYWEGQCARGLSILYGKILDTHAQLSYAIQAHEAFSKGGFGDWVDWSNLDIVVALNNKGEYQKAFSITRELIKTSQSKDDTLLMEESLLQSARILMNMGRNYESLGSYASAFNLNPSIISSDDKRKIASLVSTVSLDTCRMEIRNLVSSMSTEDDSTPNFSILAQHGKYKEAYMELSAYRIRQDSVIDVILENNVAESSQNFEKVIAKAETERQRIRMIIIYLSVVLLLFVCVIGYLYYRLKLHKKEAKIYELTAALNGIRNELRSQIKISEKISQSETQSKVRPYFDIVKERYSEINALCDDYYQNAVVGISNEKVYQDTVKTIANFTDDKYLNEVGKYVDSVSDNLYSSFKKEMYYVKEENKRVFLYYLLGFSPRSISVFLDEKISSVYNRKSRLKADIEKSTATRKEDYLKALKH